MQNFFSFNFPADKYISFNEALNNVSLILLNTHFSSGMVRPYVPNMIEVGGIQVKPEASPLPEVNLLLLVNFIILDSYFLFTF